MSKSKRRGPIIASELAAQLAADPAYQAKMAAAEAERHARRAPIRAAEQPIVRDLVAHGFDVKSVWDLGNNSNPQPYPAALPILLEHLEKGGYPDEVVESLGHRLAVRDAAFAWDRLRVLYLAADGPRAQSGLAAALAASATKDRLDDLIELLGDDTRSESRILFLRPIRRFGRDRGLTLIEGLIDDPLLGREARAILAKRRRPKGETVADSN